MRMLNLKTKMGKALKIQKRTNLLHLSLKIQAKFKELKVVLLVGKKTDARLKYLQRVYFIREK